MVGVTTCEGGEVRLPARGCGEVEQVHLCGEKFASQEVSLEFASQADKLDECVVVLVRRDVGRVTYSSLVREGNVRSVLMVFIVVSRVFMMTQGYEMK